MDAFREGALKLPGHCSHPGVSEKVRPTNPFTNVSKDDPPFPIMP